MIVKALIGRIKARLESNLGNSPPTVVEGPAVPPPAGQLPRIVVSPGKLEMPGAFGDAPPGQQRPRPVIQTFVFDKTKPDGKYTLSQSPLDGTVSCRLVWPQAGDPLEGKKQRIYPRNNDTGDGFTVNGAAREVQVFLAATLTGVPQLEVEYSYTAIFSIREFKQILMLESYAATATDAEKWASLSAAVLLINTSSLLDEANQSGNQHSEGNYATRHLVSEFQLAEGVIERAGDNIFRYTLQFRTAGQVILERTSPVSAELIRKIYSPGHQGDDGPINIEANLD